MARAYEALQRATQALHDTVNGYLLGQADQDALRQAQAQPASLMKGSHGLDAVLPSVDGLSVKAQKQADILGESSSIPGVQHIIAATETLGLYDRENGEK